MSAPAQPTTTPAPNGAAPGAQKAPAPVPGELTALVERARKYSAVLGREDLAEKLTSTRARLQDPHVRVVIVGQFKQGK